MGTVLRIKATLKEEALGTASSNINTYRQYIASNAPEGFPTLDEVDAVSRFDREDIGEDISEEDAQKIKEEKLTVFPRNKEGKPIIFDYQIRGFLKSACGALARCNDGSDYSANSKDIRGYKKVIDLNIPVGPREIVIETDGRPTGLCSRPLRTNTMGIERVALAVSESVPEGSWFEFDIFVMNDSLVDAVEDWLWYGCLNGLLQWRNSGKGSFLFKEISRKKISRKEDVPESISHRLECEQRGYDIKAAATAAKSAATRRKNKEKAEEADSE